MLRADTTVSCQSTNHGYILSLLLLPLIASAQATPDGPRRLLRCPDEFAALVEPLPASPDQQPVLTAGPGVRLRTVRFVRDSELRLDSAGRLWFSGGVSNGSAAVRGRFSGPHVLLCTDTERRGLTTFSLFVRLGSDASSSHNPLQSSFALIITSVLAGFCVLSAVLMAVLVASRLHSRNRRLRLLLAGGHQPYRDFRHFTAPQFRVQKLPV